MSGESPGKKSHHRRNQSSISSSSNNNNHESFSSTIATTNSNLSRLSKTVSSTASTLVSSSYGDLRQTPYHNAMNDIARRPGFQRRLFSFNRKTPTEMVKSTFDRKEIQYRAVTNIPDELLNNIPKDDNNQFSLYQGFEASASELNTSNNDKIKKITDGSHRQDNGTKKELEKDQDALSHRLDLLEIRKDLAATEIREIDQRIKHLEGMRKIVFDRVAKLDQEEFELERALRYVMETLGDLEDDEGEEVTTSNDTTTINSEESSSIENYQNESNSSSIDTTAIKSTNNNKPHQHRNHRRRRRSSTSKTRRKTMPALQQFYEPGKEIRTIDAHSDSITSMDFDIPFGTLVSASLDDTVKVWDLSRGEQVGQLVDHKASVKCLQMEDNIVVTGSTDATLKLWDLSLLEEEQDDIDDDTYKQQPQQNDNYSGPLVDTFDAHLGEISALHFYRNTLVSGSSDKTIRQWDLETGKCLQTLDVLWASAQNPATPQFTEDAKWRRQSTMVGGNNNISASVDFVGALQSYDAALASGTADGIVRLWDLRSGQVHRSLIGHTGAVTCLQFDENHLATGSIDRSIRIWDLRTGSIFDAFAYDSPITALHFDARRVVSANHENTVKIYDREIEKHWSCGPGELDPKNASIINTVRYKEGYLIEGRQDGQVGVWAC